MADWAQTQQQQQQQQQQEPPPLPLFEEGPSSHDGNNNNSQHELLTSTTSKGPPHIVPSSVVQNLAPEEDEEGQQQQPPCWSTPATYALSALPPTPLPLPLSSSFAQPALSHQYHHNHRRTGLESAHLRTQQQQQQSPLDAHFSVDAALPPSAQEAHWALPPRLSLSWQQQQQQQQQQMDVAKLHPNERPLPLRTASLPALELQQTPPQPAFTIDRRAFSGSQTEAPPPLMRAETYHHPHPLHHQQQSQTQYQYTADYHEDRPPPPLSAGGPAHAQALPTLTLPSGGYPPTSSTYSRESFDFFSMPSASSTSTNLTPTSPLTPAQQQQQHQQHQQQQQQQMAAAFTAASSTSPDSDGYPAPSGFSYGVFAAQQALTQAPGPSSSAAPITVALAAPPKTSKSTQDVVVSCMSCSIRLMRLYKRGTPTQLSYPGQFCFRCDECASREIGPRIEPNLRKRGRAASYNPGAAVICDVCHRNIGRGGILWPNEETDEEYKTHFTAELACLNCDVKYKKCSDCGGGGGRRGAGKWRANEMFEGRKTCVLSHKRTASAMDTEHRTMDIESLEQDELDHYYATCESLFRINMLANLAVPEMMENQDKSARPVHTFDAILDLARNGWHNVGALLYEPQAGVESKRYLAIRTGRQQRRKTTAKSTAAKEIVGFAMLEYDFRTGVLFLRVVNPWSTGDGFDSSTAMIDDALECCHQQRASFVDELCTKGVPRPMAEVTYPPITVAWTMLFFARESRIIGWMERKRNFTMLNQFLADNPDVNPQNFPPHRPTFLSPQAQIGWTILAKRIRRGQSEGVPTHGRRRGR